MLFIPRVWALCGLWDLMRLCEMKDGSSFYSQIHHFNPVTERSRGVYQTGVNVAVLTPPIASQSCDVWADFTVSTALEPNCDWGHGNVPKSFTKKHIHILRILENLLQVLICNSLLFVLYGWLTLFILCFLQIIISQTRLRQVDLFTERARPNRKVVEWIILSE